MGIIEFHSQQLSRGKKIQVNQLQQHDAEEESNSSNSKSFSKKHQASIAAYLFSTYCQIIFHIPIRKIPIRKMLTAAFLIVSTPSCCNTLPLAAFTNSTSTYCLLRKSPVCSSHLFCYIHVSLWVYHYNSIYIGTSKPKRIYRISLPRHKIMLIFKLRYN